MNTAASISQERRAIEKARSEKIQELMGEYDKTVFLPALKELQEKCAAVGHIPGNSYDNGIGCVFRYCLRCSGTISTQVYGDEEKDGE